METAGRRSTRAPSAGWANTRPRCAAGLEIFGGDVIVAPSGELTLIDLNDWPSFAPCRDRASDAIAEHLMRRVDAAWNPGLVSSANESAV